MSTENNKSLLHRFQDFLSSYKGKVLLNYAYSWGAAIVILGALFKLTHVPGANIMLWVGMGTEVLVFFVSAFDVPAKQSTGEGGTSNVNINVSGEVDLPEGVLNVTAASSNPAVTQQTVYTGHQRVGGGTVSSDSGGTVFSGNAPFGGGQPAAGNYAGESAAYIPQGGGGYAGSSPTSPSSPPPLITPEMEEATATYLEQLKEMTEMIARFSKQAENLSNDAEQMSTLNKNLSGINAIYEMQLRSVSSQIGTIDEVHEQTRKMARQIEELNAVYARMLDAMNASKH